MEGEERVRFWTPEGVVETVRASAMMNPDDWSVVDSMKIERKGMTQEDRVNLAMELVRTLSHDTCIQEGQRALLDKATKLLSDSLEVEKIQGPQGG